ncbi:hypothetical protein [Bradyrhizobium sp. CCGB01]|uniref:hypothetical protein n=1 Tax=Bradyrhizobium sp. CCGB01 TaxID=2949634 RepID=UPI0020B24C49|nr:hypothetical protein [Bradyrhizobium sp. CCGB01]MCP3407922.1 hypothetical protein [Bradyrhizobium sp. CCGB01]
MPSHDRLCSELGEQLFRSFIGAAPNVYREFKKIAVAGGPRVALHLPQRLFKLPWEVLRDPESPENNFIATTQGGSVFRCDGDGPNPRVIDYPALQPPLHFIFVLSNPSGRFFGTVAPPNSTRDVKFVIVDPASFDKYRTTIRKAKGDNLGFIFIGHGQVSADRIGHIVFIDPIRENIFFHNYAENPRPGWSVVGGVERALRLGFFCACESAWVNEGTDFSNSVVGSTLRRSKSVGYIIGAQTPIDAHAAQIMLGTTLSTIADSTLDLALTEARNYVRAIPVSRTQPYSAFDWWVPVLYTKTTNLQILDRAETSFVAEAVARVPPATAPGISVPLEARPLVQAIARDVTDLLGNGNDANII